MREGGGRRRGFLFPFGLDSLAENFSWLGASGGRAEKRDKAEKEKKKKRAIPVFGRGRRHASSSGVSGGGRGRRKGMRNFRDAGRIGNCLGLTHPPDPSL